MDYPAPVPAALLTLYRIERQLSGGGAGSVWEAVQLSTSRRVALKVLLTQHRLDATVVKRFLAEARIATTLSHPNIVPALEYDVADGVPWIAYELVTGGSLVDYLRQGPMPWPAAVLAASQVAAALGTAHAAGVLHRDVKPANVLVASPSVCQVTDFGIAKVTSSGSIVTKAGVLMGTPAYIAPELVLGQPASAASDLYALGVLLHEMVTGHRPFTASNPLALLRKHMFEVPPAPSTRVAGLPELLDALVARLLAKDPGSRPESAAALGTALEELLHGQEPPVQFPPRSTGPASEPAAPGPPATPARAVEQGPALPAGVAEAPGEAALPDGMADLAELPPALLERFDPTALLGRGGMGVVLAARDRRLERSVALKVMPRLTGAAGADPRFLREAQALAKLSHPHIVRVFDSGIADGHPYLVLEHLRGESLDAWLRRKRLSPGTAADLMESLLGALEQAHQAGLVHRDIKPSNIFMRDGAVPVLIDFGLVTFCGDMTRLTVPGTVVGTAGFMAPELFSGAPATPGTDLFALALTFLEAFLGRSVHAPPGRDWASPEEIMCSLATGHYLEVVAEAAAAAGPLGTVLLRALSATPEYRPSSAVELRRELRRAVPQGRRVTGSPRTVAPAPDAEPASPATPSAGSPRWSRWIGLGALALAVMAGLAVGAAWRVPAARPPTPPPSTSRSPSASPSAPSARPPSFPERQRAFADASAEGARVMRAVWTDWTQLEYALDPVLGGDVRQVAVLAGTVEKRAGSLSDTLRTNLEMVHGWLGSPAEASDAVLHQWATCAYTRHLAWLLAHRAHRLTRVNEAPDAPDRSGDREGVTALEEVLGTLAEALRRFPARPAEPDLVLGWHLRRVEMVARYTSSYPWARETRPALNLALRRFRQQVTGLPAPLGPHITAVAIGALQSDLPPEARTAARGELEAMRDHLVQLVRELKLHDADVTRILLRLDKRLGQRR